MGTQELVLVEHLREDSAKPFRVHQGKNSPIGYAQMTRSGGVDRCPRVPASGAYVPGHSRHCPRDAIPLPLFDDRSGAQRQQSHHRTHFESRGAAIGQPEQVVIEAILFVPHAVIPGPVHGRGNKVEMLDELEDHVLVDGILGGEFNCNLQHVLAEKRHPCRAICLFQVAAGGQWGAAVEDTDIVETEEASFEHILAEAVLPVYPPGEVQQELVESRFEKIDIRLAAPGPARVRCRNRVAQA